MRLGGTPWGKWGVVGTVDHLHGYLQFPQTVTKGFENPSAMAGAAKATTRAVAIKNFFISKSPLCAAEQRQRLAALRGLVRVRKTFGHGRRGKGDDQGHGDEKLLHC